MDIDRIKQIAKSQGKSITYICSLINRPKYYFNDLKRTGNDLPEEYANIIAKDLNVSVSYLLGESDIPANGVSPYEENLLKYFRQCDTEGQLRIIQLAMNEYDRTKAEQLNRHSAIG